MEYTKEQIRELGFYMVHKHYPDGKGNILSGLAKDLPMVGQNLRFLVDIDYNFDRMKEDLELYSRFEDTLEIINYKSLEEGLVERALVYRALTTDFEKLPLLVNHKAKVVGYTVSWRLERGL